MTTDITKAMANALRAVIEAERLADWKEGGRVKETAKKAAARAEEDFFRLRIEHHKARNQCKT